MAATARLYFDYIVLPEASFLPGGTTFRGLADDRQTKQPTIANSGVAEPSAKGFATFCRANG